MEERALVNVWYDRPGDFLEIGWSRGWHLEGYDAPGDEIGVDFQLTEDYQVVGLHILGALYSPCRRAGKSRVLAAVQPHPVTVEYDRGLDRWRVEWGPGVVACVATVNPRIRARVDASGLIQGVEIWDLRGFEGEILNQDLEPAELGVGAG